GEKAAASELASHLAVSHPYGDRLPDAADRISAAAQSRVLSLLIQSGETQDKPAAEAALREALALSPNNFAVARRLAVSLKARGDADGASRALDPLREAAKSRAYAAMSLAAGLQEIGQKEEAVSVLRKASEAPKAPVRLRIALSGALESNNELEDA